MQIEHGAPTHDLNAIRNHIDVLKGGRISRYIFQKGAKAVHIVACEPGDWELFYQHETEKMINSIKSRLLPNEHP
jgi:hypothetical protein